MAQYYTYHFKVNGRIVHGGITTDLDRREQEHQRKWPQGKIFKVGGPLSESAARAWEKSQGFA